MSNFVTVGNRLVPRDQIALVEPFDPAANPTFQTTRDFKARLVLIDRTSILLEQPLEEFAGANSFRILPNDSVALSPVVRFRVETYVPGEGFAPTKPYKTRLLWRDLDGNDQSKLLVSEPEAVLTIAVLGAAAAAPAERSPGKAPAKRKRASKGYALQP